MLQIDYLPVESVHGGSQKSGDAIAGRLWLTDGTCKVFVVDGGFSAIGDNLIEHIDQHYNTNVVDLVVSTHPDADHLNGLLTVLKNATVRELLIHRPRSHMQGSDDEDYFTNIEKVDEVIDAAETDHVRINEPFRGLTRWGGQFRVLGPTEDYYESLLMQSIADERSGVAQRAQARKALLASLGSQWDVYTRLPYVPASETLEEDPDPTSHRNNTSAIIAITDGNHRALLTGDAGIPALQAAIEEYARFYGDLTVAPLAHLQVPHHGSRRNLSPSLLDKLVGPRGGISTTGAVVSSAKADPKHPSPKVTNALLRRGVHVVATEGQSVLFHNDCPREGWTQMPSIEPLEESD